jgi:predicted TPR repeat methyltransferase
VPQHAQALHLLGVLEAQRGNFSQAATLMENSIAADPNDAMAHYNYGNVLRDLDAPEKALASYDRALALQPDRPGTLVNRGVVLHDLGRYEEALASYDAGLARNPGDAAAHFNRGNVLSMLKRYEEAVMSYRRAIALKSNYAEAYNACGNALGELGRRQEALACFERALAIWGEHKKAGERSTPNLATMQRLIAELMLDSGQIEKANRLLEMATRLNPEDETARYFLAAMSQSATPDAPPDSYVASLFDAYASKFDHHLVDELQYRCPEMIAAALFEQLGRGVSGLGIVDLGCGTGLCGPLLKRAAKRLVGVDLSEKMLEKARARGVYDELIRDEITAALARWNAEFDVAVAADVFVYVGNLVPSLKACARALKRGGLFAFTVEKQDGSGFVLDTTCRYRHSKSYLEEAAAAQGFDILRADEIIVRYNNSKPVPGLLMLLRAPLQA